MFYGVGRASRRAGTDRCGRVSSCPKVCGASARSRCGCRPACVCAVQQKQTARFRSIVGRAPRWRRAGPGLVRIAGKMLCATATKVTRHRRCSSACHPTGWLEHDRQVHRPITACSNQPGGYMSPDIGTGSTGRIRGRSVEQLRRLPGRRPAQQLRRSPLACTRCRWPESQYSNSSWPSGNQPARCRTSTPLEGVVTN
jgi:hypothetical protein